MAAAIGAYLAEHAFQIFVMLAMTAFSIATSPRPPKLGEFAQQREGMQVNTCDNTIPLPLIYGTTRVGINRVYACVTGADNKYLHVVGNVCEGEIKGIHEVSGVPQIFLDDQIYTDYGNKFYYEFFTGSATQGVCATLQAATAGEEYPWTDPKHYTAYIYCRFEYDENTWQGLPNITIVIDGLKCYNTVTTVTEYTSNPAIHAYDFLTRSSRRGGMEIASSRINTTLVNEAISYCTEKGWTCNLCLRDEISAVDHFTSILATFRGALIYSDSEFQIKYKDLNYESTVMNITENDIVEEGKSTLKIEQPSIFDTPNSIRCRWTNPGKNYTEDDFILSDSEAISADGDLREKSYSLMGMNNPSNVGKMAAYLLERERLNKRASLVMGSRGMALEPHDLVTITHYWPGWTQKIFRCNAVMVSYSGDVALVLEEEESAFYNDAYDVMAEDYYDTNLPDPKAAIPSVTNVSLTEEVYYYRERSFTRLRLDFTRPMATVYPFWDYAEIWVKIGSGDYAFMTKATSDYVLDPVEEGKTYYIKIIGVNIWGGKEDFATGGYTVSKTIVGQDNIPSNLASVVAISHGDSINVYAPELTEPDIKGYEIRIGEAWNGALFAGFNETPNFSLTGVRPGRHTVWIAALGNNGYYSTTPISKQVVVNYPPNYADVAAWSYDYSTGTHDNTEAHVYADVDCLRCAHTNGVLTGDWTSPEYDLTSKKKVRVWGDFLTHTESAEMLWSGVFTSDDTWNSKITSSSRWYEIFTPTTSGRLTAKLYYGDVSGALTEYVDRFELFCPEVEAQYLQIFIQIVDPALTTYSYVEELKMKAAWWS